MKNYAMKQNPRYGLKNHTGINYFVIVEFELMFLRYLFPVSASHLKA